MQFESFKKQFYDVLQDLVKPLTEVAWSLKEDADPDPDISESLYFSFWIIGEAMSISDGQFNIAEAEILSGLKGLLSDNDFTSPEIALEDQTSRSEELWQLIEKCAYAEPIPLVWLKIYDAVNKTQKADSLRHLYLQFALVIANADGSIEPAEFAFLAELKKILYGDAQELQDERTLTNVVDGKQRLDSEARPVEEALKELESLVGLTPVKAEISNLVNLIKINGMRKERELPVLPSSNHLVFYGNPGTGKTTIARLVAEIYQGLGVLKKGHLIETDRSGMVAGYVGQTALKVKEIVESALGGVLFIDEAYALSQEGNDYGKEAINTLLKLMEDHRHELVVIVAGYPRKMSTFIESNPGLKSRFNRYLDFPDYSAIELQSVFEGMVRNAGLVLSPEAAKKSLAIFSVAWQSKDESFGNARFARNLFNSSVAQQANRLIALSHIDDNVLSTLEADDIEL
ncbi:MAG: AAA family ATPase [Pseudomonas sp.]|nr:AAA family ATPase [Pseudomonas sp.]